MNPDLLGDERITSYGRLVEAYRRLSRIFERGLRERSGLSVTWFEALLRLGRSPERQMAITELGEQMVLTSGGATRLVDRLEEQGYLKRVACPTDRRVHWARLTDEGMAVLTGALEPHLDDLERHFASQLSDAERGTMDEALDRLRGAST